MGADLFMVVSNCICVFVITFTLYTHAAICHRQHGDVSALGYPAYTYLTVSLRYYRALHLLLIFYLIRNNSLNRVSLQIFSHRALAQGFLLTLPCL